MGLPCIDETKSSVLLYLSDPHVFCTFFVTMIENGSRNPLYDSALITLIQFISEFQPQSRPP